MEARNTLKTSPSPEPKEEPSQPLDHTMTEVIQGGQYDISCCVETCPDKNCEALRKAGIFFSGLVTCKSGFCKRQYCLIVNKKNN